MYPLIQVRELNNESLRLLTTQSGAAARNIGVLMDEVQTAWEGLQAATTNRKRKLKASLELQKFLSSVRFHMMCDRVLISDLRSEISSRG